VNSVARSPQKADRQPHSSRDEGKQNGCSHTSGGTIGRAEAEQQSTQVTDAAPREAVAPMDRLYAAQQCAAHTWHFHAASGENHVINLSDQQSGRAVLHK
jgi:hypothetical protein